MGIPKRPESFEEAEMKEEKGDDTAALAIYRQILKKNPADAKAEKEYNELWNKMSKKSQKTIFDALPSEDSEVKVVDDSENEDIPQEPIVNDDTDEDEGAGENVKEDSHLHLRLLLQNSQGKNVFYLP